MKFRMGSQQASSSAPGSLLTSPAFSPSPASIKPLFSWFLFVICSATLAVLAGISLGQVFTQPDVDWYVKIAQGNTASVLQPFAFRQLAPLVCRAIAALFHISIESAFLAEGILALLATLSLTCFLLLRAGATPLFLAAIGGLAFWAQLFNGLALPDLWFAALLSIFLVLLSQERLLLAALMLFPLYLSRESTVLVLVCFLIAGWRRMRVLEYVVALVSSFAGMRMIKFFTSGGLSNREHLDPNLYMAGKIPWNFAKNILGLPLWNDLNQANCAAPRWQMNLHLGGIHTIGVCSFQPELPAWTLRLGLSCFGLLPLLLFYVWRRRRSLRIDNFLLRFCILYGAISFALAPMLGSAVARLFAYAWPLFIVAVPILVIRHLTLPPRAALALLSLHLAVSWSAVVDHFSNLPLPQELLLLLTIAACYAMAWQFLQQATWRDANT